MSMIMIKMQKHAVEELGECIQQGLHCFGRAMSIYEDMKHSSGSDMNFRDYDGGNSSMNYRYPDMMQRDDMGDMRGAMGDGRMNYRNDYRTDYRNGGSGGNYYR